MKYHLNEQRLALYVRGDLFGADHRAAARHLDACADCRAALADFSRSYELLAGSFDEPALDELAAVRGAVSARIQAWSRSPIWRMWTTVGAAAVVAVVISLANLRQHTHPAR